MKTTRSADEILGRLVLRFLAVVAFLAAAASAPFGAVVLANGHTIPGMLLLALGALSLWLGRRAWRDRATSWRGSQQGLRTTRGRALVVVETS